MSDCKLLVVVFSGTIALTSTYILVKEEYMAETSDNYMDELHRTDYLSRFQENQCKANSLITTANCDDVESLDGYWHYSPDPYDWGLRDRWYSRLDWSNDVPNDHDFPRWPRMKIPCCWNTEKPEFFWYENTMCFYREFHFSSRNKDERVFLQFGAVQYAAYVFLNGKNIAYHIGGSTPFNVELKDELVEGKNKIVVFVESKRRPDRVPMDNTDWFNYGGMYRSVSLIRVPTSFIQNHFLRLEPDSNYSKISFSITVNNYTKPTPCVLEIEGLGKYEYTIDSENSHFQIDATPKLWSDVDPYLYNVKITYGEQIITDKVGFREIKVKGTSIYLNGKEIYLKGACMHEESVANGKAITEAEIRENFALVKELHGNFARLAHYPHTDLASRIADELGILLWEEIPVYWAIDFKNKETFADAENQLKELIYRDRNRASVIIWSVGNENEDTDIRLDFMKSLVDTCHALDSTRLTSAACLVSFKDGTISDRLADYIDIVGLNEYFGWYYSNFDGLKKLFETSQCTKPVIITEFGGGARAGHHGSERELFTETQQEWIYKNQVALFKTTDYVKGLTPWILYDFRTPHRMNPYQEGYNRKGLLSEDKKYRKKAFYIMKDFYKNWHK